MSVDDKNISKKFYSPLGWIFIFVILSFVISFVRPFLFDDTAHTSPTKVFSLNDIPYLLFLSFLRMLLAYLASSAFALTIGIMAATHVSRSRFILPLIDVLQSVPILGFFPTVIALFVGDSGSRLGVEIASIFLIFTSQSWNLVFAVYDSIQNIPDETREAVKSLGLGRLAEMRKLFFPSLVPRWIDNSILSWANGWYFLIACEIIALGPMRVELPGMGTFLNAAFQNQNWAHLILGICAFLALIICMDIFLWRPLSVWALKFRFEKISVEGSVSRTGHELLDFYRKARLTFFFRKLFLIFYNFYLKIERALEKPTPRGFKMSSTWRNFQQGFVFSIWTVLCIGVFVAGKKILGAWTPPFPISPWTLIAATLVSFCRILIVFFFSLLWILPLTYFLSKKQTVWATRLRSLGQIFASLPATAFFPLITFLALDFFGLDEIAVLLLIGTGMQWYLFFNILGGALSLPGDIREVAQSLDVKGFLYFKKIYLPSIAPSLATGTITALGAAWNSLIIAEFFDVRGTPHSVFGIGQILAEATYVNGNEKQLFMALFVLVFFIVFLNRFVWNSLFKKIWARYRLEG